MMASLSVMAGLDPAICPAWIGQPQKHRVPIVPGWMAGSSPAMTRTAAAISGPVTTQDRVPT